MPNISDTQSAISNTSNNQNLASKEKVSASGDFNTFLTLLTAQMRNQDPLKPMDSTDFVAQLASFSAVEQQIHTNDQLAELIGIGESSANGSMADWIGKEVRHKGQTSFSGSSIDIGPAVHPLAESAILIVKNELGQVVHHRSFDPSQPKLEWAGETDSGPASSGRYSFEVESSLDGQVILTEVAPVYDLVTEVRQQNGAFLLAFVNGSTMLSDEVTSLRLPN